MNKQNNTRHTMAILFRDFSSVRHMSTIFALSSGLGKCGVAVVRVSGPGAKTALQKMTKAKAAFPKPRVAELRTIVHPENQQLVLDRGLVLWFPGPSSFTGEDCAELHVHGGPAVVAATMQALARLGKSFRPAEPGEFTRRAFAAGKMDLTQVEGLGDLIHAETESQRRSALRQMDGAASRTSEAWTQSLLKALASLEAYIDFSESEEIEDGVTDDVRRRVSDLASELKSHLDDARQGERLREGVHVAIVGSPNVGKSSILNIISERDAAIVSPIAGTTRDVVETRLNFSGLPLVVMDTAGLRDPDAAVDDVEREGISRAIKNAERADLVIFVETAETVLNHGLNSHQHIALLNNAPANLTLVNKMDTLNANDRETVMNISSSNPVQFISCKTEEGLPSALDVMRGQVESLCASMSGETPLLTRERQRAHVHRALEHLEAFLEDFHKGEEQSLDLAIVCRHLRMAARELGFLTGKVESEKILDVIFADFCIGK